MMTGLFCNLLFAHVVADFYLQWNSQCKNKIEKDIKGYGLWYHALIIGIVSWIVVWQLDAWWLVLGITVSHFVVDWCKSIVTRKFGTSSYGLSLFVADQLLHIVVLYGLAWGWSRYNSWNQIEWVSQCWLQNPRLFATLMAMLLALKPANILILNILDACKVNTQLYSDNEEHGNFHSGELIGWLERGLMLVFVVLGQFEAIGFLIAGKSILRFGEATKGDEKSEYVLTGTLLSLAVALGLGLIVNGVV